MKKAIIILVLIIVFFSCQKEKGFNEIICNVENSEGLELVYYVDGKDFKNRQVKEVKDGKVIFEMKNQANEIGFIVSSFNLKNSRKIRIKILPEKRTINLHFNVVKDSIQVDDNVFEPIYDFKNINFDTNSANQKYKSIINMLNKKRLKFGVTYSKLDSLSEFVFPPFKKNVLNIYNKEVYNSNLENVLKIEILHYMIIDGFFFERIPYISNQEKEKINRFFSEVKSKTNNSNKYFKLEEKINSINNIDSKKIEFKEFVLEDINGEKVSLSGLVKKNKFTLLYFWVQNCGPCRSFNKKLQTKNKLLIENGIEIVHINVDLSRDYWKAATKDDSINWTNLYAGKNVNLHNNYRIKWWPTKVIFNKKKELIDFDFSNPEDLLKLVK
jgi:thiol-disulfide isomerase/thioredoxin